MWQLIAQVNRWLIEPGPAVTDPEVRHSARWLARLFVVMLPVGIAITLLSDYTTNNETIQSFVVLVALPVWILPYWLARRGRVQAAMALASLIGSAVVIAVAVLDSDVDDFHFLLMPLLFSSVMLPTWFVALQVGVSIVGIMLLGWSDPDFTPLVLMYNAGGFLIMSGGLVLLANHFRETREDNRRKRLVDANSALRQAIVRSEVAEAELVRLNAALEAKVAARTAELRMERERLSAVLDAMAEGVAYVEGDLLRYSNRALLEMLDLDEHLPLPCTISDMIARFVVAPENNLARETLEMPGPAHNWSIVLNLKSLQGEEFQAAITASPLLDARQQIIGTVYLVRDVSAERALEEQRNRFMTHASHELRTPVANIVTRLWLARRQPDRMDEHLDVIEDSTGVLQSLVDEILNITRLEQTALISPTQPSDLAAVIGQAVASRRDLAGTREVVVTHKLDSGLRVMMDTSQLAEAFSTILTTVIQCTEQGGAVTLATSVEQNTALVTITGGPPGLSPTDLRIVFQPFSRATEGDIPGSMFGLVLTRRVIELHQGEIVVSNQAGSRTVFEVRLPLAHVLTQ